MWDFDVVIVTYRSRPLVESLLASLPADLPVCLVDNASGADRIHELVEHRPGGRYLDGGGVGFARAANAGARSSDRRAVVFVNPDARPTAEHLQALVGDLAADDRLAAVGATTVTPEGRVELGVGGWEPTLRRALVYASGAHRFFPRAGIFARPQIGLPIELDWLTGACLAVPRARFLELGGFDERYFVYNEDVAYGRRVREAGYRQRIRTDVLVPHDGAGSGVVKTRMLQMRGASMITYVRDHNPARTVEGVRAALSLGALGRWAVCRVTGRPDAARGFAAYLRGLWLGAPDMT